MSRDIVSQLRNISKIEIIALFETVTRAHMYT